MFYQLEREFILHRVLASADGGGADAVAAARGGEPGGGALQGRPAHAQEVPEPPAQGRLVHQRQVQEADQEEAQEVAR
ncbi:hypothetical protein THAOC_24025, partial [Thalassiosira oceanica]